MDYKTLYEKVAPHRLLVMVAIPSIISMLAACLYQMVDGVFVGQNLGTQAFAAMNLVMPLVIINFSVAELIGVGSSVPIAIRLGEKDLKTANNIFTSACIMIVVSGVLLGGMFFIFADDLLRLMGADEALVALGSQYLRVYALLSPFTLIMFAVDNYLRICGKIKYSMFANIFVSVLIIIIEFIMIVVLHWGIWAAALASNLGMFIGTIICFIPFLAGKTQLQFVRPRITRQLLGTIFANGFPSFFSNISSRVTSIVINIYLLRLGGAGAVATYGVLLYADGIIQQVLYGLCDSLQPAVGYNFGAKNHQRVRKIVRMYFGVCGVISMAMTGILIFSRETLALMFISAGDQDVITMTVQAMLIFASAYLFRWISLATQCYLTAIGQYAYATMISTAMALAFPVFFLLTLTESLGLIAIWLNIPLSALAAAILSMVMIRLAQRKAGVAKV
ncbi:MATE family efflux transporter [Acetobacterium malicum]|uniref:MATE family efflux transporter n=1 Tax=Acetobacterium malicum TaxID=52692 RepID=UPI0004158B9C|nr:MATE family efflux transporter [Acetobacterium dehalogenans]